MKFSVTALMAGLGLASAFPSKFTLVADGGHTVLTDGGMMIYCAYMQLISLMKTRRANTEKLYIQNTSTSTTIHPLFLHLGILPYVCSTQIYTQ